MFIASPHNFEVKGTDKFLHALAHVGIPLPLIIKIIRHGKDCVKAQNLARKMNLKMKFIEKVAHEKMKRTLLGKRFGVGGVLEWDNLTQSL